jgi:predicted SAM-dependent methyltransferase
MVKDFSGLRLRKRQRRAFLAVNGRALDFGHMVLGKMAVADQVLHQRRPRPEWPRHSQGRLFAEQLIEHVTLAQGQGILRECHRILRDGGKIRIASPNLTTFAKLFTERDESSHHYLQLQMEFVNARRPDGAYLSTVPTPECEVLNMQMHFFGHRYLYDPDSLRAVLAAAGFQKVQMAEIGLSSDPALSGIDSHAKITGDELNRFVTMVVEASK